MNAQPFHPLVDTHGVGIRNPRSILGSLAACMALQMTSFVMILPLFARRFENFGDGVEVLGISSLAYALAATLAAPFMGALADRFGRRPLVLIPLAIYVLAFTGYLFAASSWTLVLIRALAGGLTAGLVPTMTSLVVDLAANDRRAQWISILSGGASVGWIAGPLLGGLLYDRWGYIIPFAVAVGLALAAFVVAAVIVPETQPAMPANPQPAARPGLRAWLPKSLPLFALLMTISFLVMFAWAFIEPQFMFYAYDDLQWTSSQLGMAMSVYGTALMFGEFALGHLSDRIGRKPVLVSGLALFMAQFAGLVLFHDFVWIAFSFLLAGLGNALFDPALSAYVLDITPPEHKARILGFKSTAASLGNVLGPALAVLFASSLGPQGVFLVATALVSLMTVTLALVMKRSLSET